MSAMSVMDLQTWINQKIKSEGLSIPPLKLDGQGGPTTRATFIMLFVNKNPKKITDDEKMQIARQLNDTSIKRVNAIGAVETSGSPYFSNGLPKILYERHYFYKFTMKSINWLSFGMLADPGAGGYTVDADANGINDNWDKLAAACCIDPDSAIQSVSIGAFQVMGKWYKECGYSSPIEMLWDARQGELGSYKMLAGFVRSNGLVPQFLAISADPKTNVAFVTRYNGPSWIKNDYANKLAKAMN